MARHHDLVIIGSGSGNSLLTPELDGLDVAVIEAGTFGGTCLNVGCIPTKMFVLPADLATGVRESARLGVHARLDGVDWRAVRDRVFGRIDPISAGGRAYRESQPDVHVYAAHARFVGPRTLAVGGEVVSTEQVVIATGSRPMGLDLPGLDGADPEAGVHTSDTVMRMAELPARMAVVGGGFIAAEFAHVFDAFGVGVTWIHRGDRLLKAEDDAVAEAFTAAARERFDLRLHCEVTAAERSADGVWSLGLTDGSLVEVDAVLLAVGRTPNTDDLGVADGGVALHADGRVVVDAEQRTSAEGVFALGDVSSPFALKHVANHEARVVAHNLAVDLGRLPGPPARTDHRFVPHAVFTHPQIASFGPTGRELEARGIPFVATTQAYGDTAYGWALEDESSFLTVYANPSSGRVVAAHCIGPQASTLIQPLIQAASFGPSAHEVARGQYWIHPALAEVVENALLGLPL